MSNSSQPHGLWSLPCLSLFPEVCSDSCALSWWCHLINSSSVVPFSSCLQSFLASGSFPMSWLFTSGGQSIGASASTSVLLMDIQGGFPLGWAGLISLQFRGLSNTTVQKHPFQTPYVLPFAFAFVWLFDCPHTRTSAFWGQLCVCVSDFCIPGPRS